MRRLFPRLSVRFLRQSAAGVSRARKPVRIAILGIFLTCLFQGCKPSTEPPASVTIILLDPGWLERGFREWRAHEMEQFKQETGISVKLLPTPETAVDQLTLLHKLLNSPDDAPDVFANDVIWPELIAQYALPLDVSLTQDASGGFPFLLANNTVGGNVIAMPYHIDAGLLFYRTDLLKKYGYGAPPATWTELENMAARIQKGERAKGNRDFWGFVWQGSPSEALTCNALEWQLSDGAGNIMEKDRTIGVNNQKARRTWERAARWVGTISPPGVTAYREWDALNIWRVGNAAFMRNWPTSYLISGKEGSTIVDKFGAALLPAGSVQIPGIMGGANLSVFRNTKHRKEALALVRFLCRRDVQKARALATTQPPTFIDLYDDPEVLRANPHFAQLKDLFLHHLAMRPSNIVKEKYPEVSAAYFQAIHSVLVHESDAAKAGEKLEADLARITGFPISGRNNP